MIAALAAPLGPFACPARASAVTLPPGCTHSGLVVSCMQTFTSGSNPFTVPVGVSSIDVVAVGAAGVGGANGGGNGAVGVIREFPFACFDGFGGGGGGGASDVRTMQGDPATRLLAAAGGGGEGGGEIMLGGVAPSGGAGGAGEISFELVPTSKDQCKQGG